MRCPTLSELPVPPAGKVGWPWTIGNPQSENVTACGFDLPRLSIITPSFNQGEFIEETIRSILLQGYPDLEYIIIDGGSSDNSRCVIEKYQRWIAYWCSEPDAGQSDAINKGLRRCSGEWVNWINSDDMLATGALAAVGLSAKQVRNDTIIVGNVVNFEVNITNEISAVCLANIDFTNVVKFWKRDCVWHQPGLFFPRQMIDDVGGIDINLHYAMDHDLLLRLLNSCDIFYLGKLVSYFRLHNSSKGVTQKAKTIIEKINISGKYWHLTRESIFMFRLNIAVFLVRFLGSSIKHKRWRDLQLMFQYMRTTS